MSSPRANLRGPTSGENDFATFPTSSCAVVGPDLMAAALRAIDSILEEEDVENSDRGMLRCDTVSLVAGTGLRFPPPTSGHTPPETDEGNYLRSWFLSNLAHPFPSRAERERMASMTDSTPRNVEASFTNWRRRSGWSTIRRRWGGQSKTGMRSLLKLFEAGVLEPEVSDAITEMQSYFASDTARPCIEEVSVVAGQQRFSHSS